MPHPIRGRLSLHPFRERTSCGSKLNALAQVACLRLRQAEPAPNSRIGFVRGPTACPAVLGLCLLRGGRWRPADLWDQPLIISHQRSDDRRLAQWMQRDLSQLHIVATYNLVFNASLLVDEGLGYALCFDRLINTRGSSLCFRPFAPRLESTAYIIWKKYQVFSKAASAFLACLKQLTEQ